MSELRIPVIITEDHQIVGTLPDDVPVGPAELVVTITPNPPQSGLTREVARARLAAAGALSTAYRAPESAQALTPEERAEYGELLPGPSLDDIISEDRGQV